MVVLTAISKTLFACGANRHKMKKGFERLLVASTIHVMKRYDNGELAMLTQPLGILGHETNVMLK